MIKHADCFFFDSALRRAWYGAPWGVSDGIIYAYYFSYAPRQIHLKGQLF